MNRLLLTIQPKHQHLSLLAHLLLLGQWKCSLKSKWSVLASRTESTPYSYLIGQTNTLILIVSVLNEVRVGLQNMLLSLRLEWNLSDKVRMEL